MLTHQSVKEGLQQWYDMVVENTRDNIENKSL